MQKLSQPLVHHVCIGDQGEGTVLLQRNLIGQGILMADWRKKQQHFHWPCHHVVLVAAAGHSYSWLVAVAVVVVKERLKQSENEEGS